MLKDSKWTKKGDGLTCVSNNSNLNLTQVCRKLLYDKNHHKETKLWRSKCDSLTSENQISDWPA